MSLSAETRAEIVAIVTAAIKPLVDTVQQLRNARTPAAITLGAVSTLGAPSSAPIQFDGIAAARTGVQPKVAFSVMAACGVEVPYRGDGSISLFQLQKTMDSAGISKARQTTIKSSLYVSGCNIVP